MLSESIVLPRLYIVCKKTLFFSILAITSQTGAIPQFVLKFYPFFKETITNDRRKLLQPIDYYGYIILQDIDRQSAITTAALNLKI